MGLDGLSYRDAGDSAERRSLLKPLPALESCRALEGTAWVCLRAGRTWTGVETLSETYSLSFQRLASVM